MLSDDRVSGSFTLVAGQTVKAYSPEELRTSLEIIIMRECLPDRRQWFGHPEKNEREYFSLENVKP